MKKTLSAICIVVVIMTLSACKTNMRRDVKRLTHKTEQSSKAKKWMPKYLTNSTVAIPNSKS